LLILAAVLQITVVEPQWSRYESVQGHLYNRNYPVTLTGSGWAARTTCVGEAAAFSLCLALVTEATLTPNGCQQNRSCGRKVGRLLISKASKRREGGRLHVKVLDLRLTHSEHIAYLHLHT
jgi:hypothetical protein